MARKRTQPLSSYTVTGKFGESRPNHTHAGEDMAIGMGTPIMAVDSGTVIQAGPNGGYGNFVAIKHPDGSVSEYGHANTIGVKVGQQVKQGQQIATVGSTGHSTGPHLHFEVHEGGKPIDPTAYLAGAGSMSPTATPAPQPTQLSSSAQPNPIANFISRPYTSLIKSIQNTSLANTPKPYKSLFTVKPDNSLSAITNRYVPSFDEGQQEYDPNTLASARRYLPTY